MLLFFGDFLLVFGVFLIILKGVYGVFGLVIVILVVILNVVLSILVIGFVLVLLVDWFIGMVCVFGNFVGNCVVMVVVVVWEGDFDCIRVV